MYPIVQVETRASSLISPSIISCVQTAASGQVFCGHCLLPQSCYLIQDALAFSLDYSTSLLTALFTLTLLPTHSLLLQVSFSWLKQLMALQCPQNED